MAENVTITRELAREIRKAKQVTSLEDGDQLLTFRETDRGKPDLRRVAQTAVAGAEGLAAGAVPIGPAEAALASVDVTGSLSASSAIEAACATGVPAKLKAGQYLVATPVSIGARQSLSGVGYTSVIKAASAPSITTMFMANSNGAGGWLTPYPGVLSSEISDLFVNAAAAAAAGYKLTAFEFGGSQKFRKLKFWGLQTAIKQIAQYSDGVRIEETEIGNQPSIDAYAIDLPYTGDAVYINQATAYRTYDDGNDGNTDPSTGRRARHIRLRYKAGATISNVINGDILIDSCLAVAITSLHMEDGIVTLLDSEGSLRQAAFWMRGDGRGEISTVPLVFSYGSTSSAKATVFDIEGVSFVYHQSFPGGYTTTKHNFSVIQTPSIFSGHLTFRNMFRCIIHETLGGYAAQRFGVSCGDASFDNYSHIASKEAKFSRTGWQLRASIQDLPSTTAGIDTSSSALSSDKVWQGPTGTYYYKAVVLLDKIRLIGLVGSAEKSMSPTNGGNCPVVVLSVEARSDCIIRLYRGSSPGSYNYYVDLPLFAASRLADSGNDVAGFPWVSRTPAGVDAINSFGPVQYRLEPGETLTTADAYGNVTVRARTGATIPTVGSWRRGDLVLLANPTKGTGLRFLGWQRATDCTSASPAHVLDTDWIELWDRTGSRAGSSANFSAATDTVNTVGKYLGWSAWDVTTGQQLWPSGTSATAPWKDKTGTTVYTPS